MDVIGKMDENHDVADIDGVIDEVAEARGTYDSLDDRLEAIEETSGELTIVELLSAPIVGAVNSIALTDDMNKYDILVFRFGVAIDGNNQIFENTLYVRDVCNMSTRFFVSGYLPPSGYGIYYNLSYADSNHFTVLDSAQGMWSEDRTIFGITGIKF